MSKEISQLLYEIYLGILTISFIASILNRKNLPSYYWLLSLLLGLTIVNECTAFYFLYYPQAIGRPYFLYHFFIPVYYSLLAGVYYKYFEKPVVKKLVLYSIPAFILVNVVLSTTLQKLNVVNTYSFMLLTALVLGWVLYYFYELMHEYKSPDLLRMPFFWINAGNLFFYPGMFFLMSFLNVLIENDPALLNVLYNLINRLLNYMLYTLFTIGFLCTIRKKKLY